MALSKGVLAAALVTTLQHAGASSDTPISKVIELMSEMLKKGVAEKEAETTRMAAFSQWCRDQKTVKTGEIQNGNDRIEELNAGIEVSASSIRRFTDRIQELDGDIARWSKDTQSAQVVRDKENTDYEATLTDYEETLNALDEAIIILKKQAVNTPQAEQLVQVFSTLRRQKAVPAAAKSIFAKFLQETQTQAQPAVEEMPEDNINVRAPEAYAYEFQSGSVVDMLTKLKGEFADKKGELMKEELNSKHNFEMLAQQLADNIEGAKHEIQKKDGLRAETQQTKASDEGELKSTTNERDADKDYLADTNALCDQKTTDFNSRSELRQGELDTLKKAIEIISSETVSGAGDKHLPAMLQASLRSRKASLSQLRSTDVSPLQAQIADLLAQRAKVSGSRLLSMVSQKVSSEPFTKVKKLIKDLISQLMQESTAETEHKGWCDAELGTNKQTRDARTEDVNSLTIEVDDLNAEIQKLTQDLSDLAAAIRELDQAMATATSDRNDSKATNEQTIQEAKEARVAVGRATALVKDFYAKSSEATALVQQTPAEDAPETFSEPYQGQLPEGGNVIDFLEVILADFVRLESDTTSAEEAEQKQYDTFMFESKKDKALKENDVQHKTDRRVDRESSLHRAQEELKMAQDQLDKAIAYYDKLKPTCVDSGITYEQRIAGREAEIQSLQEALKILNGEDIA